MHSPSKIQNLLVMVLVGVGSWLRAAEPAGVPVEQSEVTFRSGRLSLSASLSLPKRPGKIPGIVIVHGSGNSDRDNPWTLAYANALTQRGIAVLHPDKRGCGKSEGDWRSAGMAEFAEDAIAGIAQLRRIGAIDPKRVGLIGFSQGGHVVPLAASRSPEIQFAITVSSSAVPMSEQMADEITLSAERAGLTAEQIKRLEALHETGMRFLDTNRDEDWTIYENARKALAGTPLVERFPTTREDPALEHIRRIKSFDPIPFWKSVTVPALFVFGGNDTQIRPKKTIARIQDQLVDRQLNYTILLFSPNGHALFREDLCEFLTRWIQDLGRP